MMSSSRDLSLLRRALRYERDMREVSSASFFSVYVYVCVLLASKPKKKNHFFYIYVKKKPFASTDTQSLG